jgi:hypothetical protein
LAIAPCVSLLACGTGAAYALSASKTTEQPAVTPDARASARTLDSDHTTAASIGCETGKDETVYVLTAADGSTQSVIVSDWLKNGEAADTLNDASRLTDIETVKGDAAFTEDDDGSLVWDTKGGDVYYQGTAEKDLPVGVEFTYRLDGKTISPEELAGKSGKLTIEIRYTNNERQTVTVNGAEETVYVPFLMVTGLLMNIPADLYESARIDGANAFQTFRKITLPYMLFVTGPFLLTQFIGNLNNFNVIFLLNQGNPKSLELAKNAGSTDLLVTWLYKMTINDSNYKIAAVIGIMVFLVTAIISLVVYNVLPSVRDEEGFQ